MTDSADNSFSPPEIQTLPGATDLVVDVVPQVGEKRRSKWLLGGAVAAVAAIGVGVFALVGGSDKAHASYSLTAAAASAESAQTVAYESTVEMGSFGSAEVTGRFDVAHKLMVMDVSMPTLGDQKVSVVMDLGNGVMYMDAGTLGQSGAFPTKWVSFDFSAMPSMKEALSQTGTSNPLDVAKVFAKAKSVEDLGTEDFRGEQVKHYKVTVDTAAALAVNPTMKEQFAKLGSTFPDELTYDVYVNADSQLRRVAYAVDMAGQSMKVDMVFTAVDTIEPILIPAADEVTDISDMLPQA